MLPPSTLTSGSTGTLTYSPNCTVYYYNNMQTSTISSVSITYLNAAGASVTASATPWHIIYRAAAPVAAGAAVRSLPSGQSCRMQDVQVGDLIAVHDASLGGFYTAAVTAVANTTQSGAFSPYLLGGGLPLVYDSLFYAFTTSDKNKAAQAFQYNALKDLYHVAQWRAAKASLAQGCLKAQPAGQMPRISSLCPCLDEQTPCVRMGAPLFSVPQGLNPINAADMTISRAARAAGETLLGGIGAILARLQAAVAAGQTFTQAAMTAFIQSEWGSSAAAGRHRRSLLQAQSGTYATGRGFYGVFWCAQHAGPPGDGQPNGLVIYPVTFYPPISIGSNGI